MKKIVYSLAISALTISLIGCDDMNPNEDKFNATPSAGYVEFSMNDNGTPDDPDDDWTYAGLAYNANVGCAGSSTEIRVPITLYAPVNQNGLDVNFTITDLVGTSAGNVNIEANFPSGELEGEVVISFSETLNNSVQFNLTLESTSNNNVTIGAPDSTVEQTIRVNLNKEQRDQFQGNYTVTRGTNTYSASIAAGTAPNELIITNLYGPAYPGSQTRIFLDAGGVVSFPAIIDNYLADDPNVGPLYVQGISGTWGDSCAGELSLVFRLRYGANQGSQTAQATTVFARQ